MKYVIAAARGLLLILVSVLICGVSAHAQDPPPALRVDLGATVRLDFPQTTVAAVLDAIGKSSRLNFVFDDQVDLGASTSVDLADVSVAEGLRFFLRANHLFYVVRGPDTLLIAPDTRQKRQEYMPRAIRTFSLEHADSRGMVTVLRSMLGSRQIVVDERLRTVSMNDTVDQLDLADEIVRRLDRERDEISEAVDSIWIGSDVNHDFRSLRESVPTLEVDMERRLSLEAAERKARDLYESIENATGVQFIFDGRVDLDQVVTFGISKLTAREALDLIDEQLASFSVVWGPRTVFVTEDTRQQRQMEENAGIRFFYLSHADTRSVVTSLRTMLQVRQIAEIPRLRAVIVRDDVDALDAATQLVADMDVQSRDSPSNPAM